MSTLEGKVALVTGAASGIGAATAKLFVERGARVVIADIQEAPGKALADEIGAAARFVRADVSQEADIENAIATAESEFGPLDIMVNNAGILGVVGSITELDAEAWDNTVAVLLRGAFLGTKHAARVMQPRGSGVILSIASTAGVMGGLGPHAYTVSKHGVVGLTKSAASELSASGVRVNAVAPGSTVSAMTAAVFTGNPDDEALAAERIGDASPMGSAIAAEEIAGALAYLASDDARHVTGHVLVVDAGATSAPPTSPFHGMKSTMVREAGRRTEN